MARDTEQLLVIAAIIAGLYVYSDVKKTFSFNTPLTQNQTSNMFGAAGFTTTDLGNGEVTANIPGGVIYIPQNSYLSGFQRSVLWADQYVPGTWLSRSLVL